jgi:histone-lysine N-methyltransferase SETMAR
MEFAGIIYKLFDCQVIVHCEFIPEGQSVNKGMYSDILRRLRDAVRRKRPEKWRANSWFLLHNNAPAHRPVSIKEFIAKNNLTALEHPPYSPKLAAADF